MSIRTIRTPANGGIPNHPRWPALVLPGVADPGIGVQGGRTLVSRNGWGGAWDWTVYDYHHFHPDAHEALLCVAGRASILLGGEAGETVEIAAGDGLILPAGFGHRRLASDDGFRVVGCYPPGQESPQILRADPEAETRWADEIAAVPRPDTDPFGSGALPDAWSD